MRPSERSSGHPVAAAADRASTVASNVARRGVLTGPGEKITFARWPRSVGAGPSSADGSTIARRVAEVSLAWLPIAAVIGFGAPDAIGCSVPAASCPESLPSLQALLAVLVLAMVVAFPVMARVAALAAVTALAVALPLLVFGALLGLLPPARPIALAFFSIVALAYLIGAGAATWMAARSVSWRGAPGP